MINITNLSLEFMHFLDGKESVELAHALVEVTVTEPYLEQVNAYYMAGHVPRLDYEHHLGLMEPRAIMMVHLDPQEIDLIRQVLQLAKERITREIKDA